MRVGEQQCAVLVRGSNVGELTPRGQEAVRCVQGTLLQPQDIIKCPRAVYGNWRRVHGIETGVPCTVHTIYIGTLVQCSALLVGDEDWCAVNE